MMSCNDNHHGTQMPLTSAVHTITVTPVRLVRQPLEWSTAIVSTGSHDTFFKAWLNRSRTITLKFLPGTY